MSEYMIYDADEDWIEARLSSDNDEVYIRTVAAADGRSVQADVMLTPDQAERLSRALAALAQAARVHSDLTGLVEGKA